MDLTAKKNLSKNQRLQFDQLCQDIDIELKYAGDNHNDVLSAYQAMFDKPNGLRRLLSMKPAIALSRHKKLPAISDKALNQSLLQLKQQAQHEQGKVADILNQTISRLHQLAWLGEQKKISTKTIDRFKKQLIKDPRYQCLQQSRAYQSLFEWLIGVCLAIKQLISHPTNPSYHYGFFSKQTAYLEQAISMTKAITACA